MYLEDGATVGDGVIDLVGVIVLVGETWPEVVTGIEEAALLDGYWLDVFKGVVEIKWVAVAELDITWVDTDGDGIIEAKNTYKNVAEIKLVYFIIIFICNLCTTNEQKKIAIWNIIILYWAQYIYFCIIKKK